MTVTGISHITTFNIFYWTTYMINNEHFKDYIKKENVNKIDVVNFLENNNLQESYDFDKTSAFLLLYPTSYFLVGGRGHWSYAVNTSLLTDDSHNGGANKKLETYKLKTTKKVKNKYYQKSSAKKGTKKRKMTKKHMKSKEYKKGKKKTIKHT